MNKMNTIYYPITVILINYVLYLELHNFLFITTYTAIMAI